MNRLSRPNSLKVTAKGQVTLRREVLAHLGVKPGDRLVVETMPDGKIMVSPEARKGHISELFGCLAGKTDVKLSLDDIDDLIGRGYAGKL